LAQSALEWQLSIDREHSLISIRIQRVPKNFDLF
jgi:hypothetical protein